MSRQYACNGRVGFGAHERRDLAGLSRFKLGVDYITLSSIRRIAYSGVCAFDPGDFYNVHPRSLWHSQLTGGTVHRIQGILLANTTSFLYREYQ